MFRKIVVLAVICFLAMPCYAYENQKVLEQVISADTASIISVPLTNTIRTKSISMRQASTAESMGIMYKAESPGTITMRLDLEQGYDVPATEGSYDLNYITTDTVDSSISNNLWKMATIDTVVMPYVRFKITGSGSNDIDTTIKIKVTK